VNCADFDKITLSDDSPQPPLRVFCATTKQKNMRKVILTYGLIAGAIVSAFMFITMPLWESGVINFDNGEAIGYTTMVISLSMIFFGIKSCRDNYFQGRITFGQGVKIGLLITLIAAVMYALTWEICVNTIATDFAQNMSDHYVQELKNSGKDRAEIDAGIAQMDKLKEWYKNPILRFAMTLFEIVPVGVVITLVSAFLLRRRQSMAEETTRIS
jgi:hypothetical protein